MPQHKKVVTISGGTGGFTVLSGLKKYKDLDLTAIVAMTDSGGSTGLLRDELGVLPPGDARQCLIALSHNPGVMRELFTYRYQEGHLTGHNFGNLFLSTLEKITGDFTQAVEQAAEVLNVEGAVKPVTTTNTNLCVDLANQQKTICGEQQITQYEGLRYFGLERFYLDPPATINESARQAILEADAVVIGPGNLYASILPHFLVAGMSEALQETNAQIIFNCNLMIKYGHTDGFCVQDFVREVETYVGAGVIDSVLYNTQMPSSDLLERYQEEGAPVRFDDSRARENSAPTYIGEDVMADAIYSEAPKKDLLRRTLIRHDSDKLAMKLYKLLSERS